MLIDEEEEMLKKNIEHGSDIVQKMDVTDIKFAICPGCAKVHRRRLQECPKCGYEFGAYPYKMLFISDILAGEEQGICDSVSLSKYVRTLVRELKVSLPNLMYDSER